MFTGCGVQADRSCLFFFCRCTRRSECRRAEEKNGWLWSPRQHCVKIVSFFPPNLSCKKTQEVQPCVSSHSFSLILSFCSLLLFLSPSRSAQHNPTNMHSLSNKQFFIVNQRPWALGLPAMYRSVPKNCKLAYYNQPG